MKINYKNTALSFLDEPEKMAFWLSTPSQPMTDQQKRLFGHSLKNNFKECVPVFSNKIQYISDPFMQAYFKGRHKLKDIFQKEQINESGTFIWKGDRHTFTNFYYIQTTGTGKDWKCEWFFLQFSKAAENDLQNLDVMISETSSSLKTFIWEGHARQGYDSNFYLAFLVGFILFIKYVELETRVVKANKREKHVGTKYVNETKRDIEVLDSTWFTTIISSEGFDVSPHLRFQVHGRGRAGRKLIWISQFSKEGYTRKARRLLVNP